MKLKLTEQQIKGLVKKLDEEDSFDFEKEAPNLSKLGKLLASDPDTSNTNNNTDNGELKFATDIPIGDKPMSPLGRRVSIASKFGPRNIGIGSRDHKGVDLNTSSGSPVYAPLDGIVLQSRDSSPDGCGGFIMLKHKSMDTVFCHLSKMIVNQGEKKKKGQIIGYSGGGRNDRHPGTSTGPHLHYAIHINGSPVDPLKVQSNLV